MTGPASDDGERLLDSTGCANHNANPPIEIDGVPDDAEVHVVDDPDAQPVAGRTWDHWLAWNVDPEIETVPENWDAADAVEGYNDYVERGYGGPSRCPRKARKIRLGSAIAMETGVLAATQLAGTYDASPGAAF